LKVVINNTLLGLNDYNNTKQNTVFQTILEGLIGPRNEESAGLMF